MPKNSHAKKDDALCACTMVHEDIVRAVKAGLSDDSKLQRVAELFKVMNDPTRLKIINALMISEMCVCDITALLDMSQPAISHHLKVLRQTRLVKYRRKGKSVFYTLDDKHVKNVFKQGLSHVSEQ